ncbi:MAG: glycoside hydrolase family protein [Alphaproteobacteria bacterium]|nr:glycoside hydrolase family protein [Alphaproteobacteria bacterium]
MIDEFEAIQRLSLHEGIRLQPYRCPRGFLTIGIGRNLEANPLSREEIKVLGRRDLSSGITRQEAFFLLRGDIRRTINYCRKKISFFDKLDDERQYVLVDMAFNLGIGGLLKFQKMLYFIGSGNYRQAATEMLSSSYARQVKLRAERLAQTLHSGKWHL